MIRSIPILLAVALLVAVMGVALMQSGALTMVPASISTDTLGGLPIDIVSFGGGGGTRK